MSTIIDMEETRIIQRNNFQISATYIERYVALSTIDWPDSITSVASHSPMNCTLSKNGTINVV